MHDRVLVVVLSVCMSVCLSRYDFRDYWQLTIDLGRNLLRTKIVLLLILADF